MSSTDEEKRRELKSRLINEFNRLVSGAPAEVDYRYGGSNTHALGSTNTKVGISVADIRTERRLK
jgi:hypothetical protein